MSFPQSWVFCQRPKNLRIQRRILTVPSTALFWTVVSLLGSVRATVSAWESQASVCMCVLSVYVCVCVHTEGGIGHHWDHFYFPRPLQFLLQNVYTHTKTNVIHTHTHIHTILPSAHIYTHKVDTHQTHTHTETHIYSDIDWKAVNKRKHRNRSRNVIGCPGKKAEIKVYFPDKSKQTRIPIVYNKIKRVILPW